MSYFKDRRKTLQAVVIGILVFVVGVCVYMFDRRAGSAYLLPSSWRFYSGGHSLFGPIGNSLPSLFHAFSFSIFTSLLLPRRIGFAASTCAAWGVLEALFEVGQHRSVAPVLMKVIGTRFRDIPVLDHLSSYFTNGVFDFNDVLFGFVGSSLAFYLLYLLYFRNTRQ